MKFHVDCAINVRDNEKGRYINSLAELKVTLDGERVMPIFKQGGWLIFCGLEQGRHKITIGAQFRQKERILIDVAPGSFSEHYVELKPDESYARAYGFNVLKLCIMKEDTMAKGAKVLICSAQYVKLAEDNPTESLISVSPISVVPYVSTPYLVKDEERSELCFMYNDGSGKCLLATPLKNPHKRGTQFVRVTTTNAYSGKAIVVVKHSDQQEFYVHNEGIISHHVVSCGGSDTCVLI